MRVAIYFIFPRAKQPMWYNGFLDLSAWQLVAVTLLMTHVTIIGVTVYLHRYSAHRSLELNGGLKHFFRFWLWLTTAQNTREWTAIHRKHHAKCETADDPHSPVVKGLSTVLRKGAELYREEAQNPETLRIYGKTALKTGSSAIFIRDTSCWA
jgi:stearoyl-CoA desaturase (Delta-9 desaturase)